MDRGYPLKIPTMLTHDFCFKPVARSTLLLSNKSHVFAYVADF